MSEKKPAMVRMEVSTIALDGKTNMPFVVLEDEKKKRSLPIWVGIFEASAIATQLEGIELARPMTHDLLKDVIEKGKGTLNHVEVVDLKDNTYYGAIVLTFDGEDPIRVDSRPSDAIALALRFEVPILVNETVLEKSKEKAKPTPAKPADKERWAEMLKNLSPEAFGKYKM